VNDGIGNNRRVLLVEDAPLLRYAFARLLRMYGFDVREATDGRQALDYMGEFQPELVLTDLMMPLMDGIELIRYLHDDPATTKLPVVAITADATEQAQRQALDAGAIDVITKPIDLPSLLERLRFLHVFEDDAPVTQAPITPPDYLPADTISPASPGLRGAPSGHQK